MVPFGSPCVVSYYTTAATVWALIKFNGFYYKQNVAVFFFVLVLFRFGIFIFGVSRCVMGSKVLYICVVKWILFDFSFISYTVTVDMARTTQSTNIHRDRLWKIKFIKVVCHRSILMSNKIANYVAPHVIIQPLKTHNIFSLCYLANLVYIIIINIGWRESNTFHRVVHRAFSMVRSHQHMYSLCVCFSFLLHSTNVCVFEHSLSQHQMY